MPMLLKLADGTSLRPIPDQTLDTVQTSIALIGKGWIGYTEFWNQNLLAMLGNFASVSRPAQPLTGQLWFDKNTSALRLQIGDGKPEVDAQIGAGWSAPLLTAGTKLIFTDTSSDIVVPAVGTIAAPPALVLKNVNGLPANATGTFNTVVVNSKGLVVGGETSGFLGDIMVTGDASGASIGNTLNLTLSNTVNANPGSFNTVVVNAKGLVVAGAYLDYVTTSQGLTITGDATGSGTFGGANGVTLTLAAVNSNVGTYNTVTVNAKGLVTAATNTSYVSSNGDPCTTATLTTNYTITDATPIYWLTVNANVTITLNVAADPNYAKSLSVALIGDGTHSASFAATGGIVWDMGSALSMNTAYGKTSVFTFLCLPGTTKWFAGRAVYEV